MSRKQALTGLVFILGLAVIVLAAFVRTELDYTGGELGVPLDDAWIHFQFARNLSQGSGFSFNPGEPTPGSTAPLWTVLLAGVGLFRQEFLRAALILSTMFFLLTIVLTYLLAAEVGRKRSVGLVAAAGVLLSGRLVWAGLAGMETTAFTALSLGALWLYSRNGLSPASAILFGLASQARPEGNALFALAVADTLWTIFVDRKQSSGIVNLGKAVVGRLAIPVLLYCLLLLPYSMFSLSQTGRPLANTFYAKVNARSVFSTRTLLETLTIHFRDNPVAFLLLIPGMVPTWRRSRLVVAWLILLPILTAFLVDFTLHHGRYTMPLIPLVMVVAAQGIDWLAERLPARSRPYAAAVVVLALVIAGALQLPRWARLLGQNSREILTVDVAIGKWLAENTPEDAQVAVDDIGAIGYMSGRTIFDLNGLISPEMWLILHNEPRGQLRDEATTRLLSEVGSDYLAIFPLWHWELANNPAVAQAIQEFHSESRTIIGAQDVIVYRTRWPYQLHVSSPREPAARLGDQILLLDYELSPPVDSENELQLTLQWQSLGETEESYDVFVHVLDSDGAIIAQADSEPVQGLAPTSRWQPGDIIRDTYLLELPQDNLGGTYRVQAGMYDRETGKRLATEAPETRDDAIFLGAFEW